MRTIILFIIFCMGIVNQAFASATCPIRLWAATPYKVEFHARKIKGPVLGIHQPLRNGYQWIFNSKVCLQNESVYAIAWIGGKAQKFISREKLFNINRQIVLVFPQGFEPYRSWF